jgi:hypothetical protein
MRFKLTPPSFGVFLLSVLLASLAVATLYFRVPVVGHFIGSHRFWALAAAYVLLLAGVVFRGL